MGYGKKAVRRNFLADGFFIYLLRSCEKAGKIQSSIATADHHGRGTFLPRIIADPALVFWGVK
jgi:hypothetical protein